MVQVAERAKKEEERDGALEEERNIESIGGLNRAMCLPSGGVDLREAAFEAPTQGDAADKFAFGKTAKHEITCPAVREFNCPRDPWRNGNQQLYPNVEARGNPPEARLAGRLAGRPDGYGEERSAEQRERGSEKNGYEAE